MVFKIQKVKDKQLYRVINTITKGIILTTSSKQQAIKIKNVLNKKPTKRVIKKPKKRQLPKLTGQLKKLNELLLKSQSGEYGSFDLPRKQGEFITRIINKDMEQQQQQSQQQQISPQQPSLTGLKVADLKRLAQERGIKVPTNIKKKQLLDSLTPPITTFFQRPQQVQTQQQQQQPQQQSQSAIEAFNIATGQQQTKQQTIDLITDIINKQVSKEASQLEPIDETSGRKQKISRKRIQPVEAQEEEASAESRPSTPTDQDTGVDTAFFSPQAERKQKPPKLDDLKKEAKAKGIKGFSTMKKQELINALAPTQVADATASGIFDSIRGYVSNLINKEQYSLPVKSLLERLGDKRIIAMNIIRTPINKNINRALNVISLGQWSKLKNEFNYDNMFHLALIVKLEDMTNLLIEKNERINISTSFKYLPTTEIKHINITGKSIILNDLLNNGNRFVGNTNWFIYSAFKNNCQAFIKATLEGNGIYTPEINNFVYQDMSEIRKQLPRNVVPTANFITDLGSLVSRLRGRGY